MGQHAPQLRRTLRIVIAPNWPAGISDEAEAFHPLTIKPAEKATEIPDTSPLSLWELKQSRRLAGMTQSNKRHARRREKDGTTFNQNAVPA